MIDQYKRMLACLDMIIEDANNYRAFFEEEWTISHGLQNMVSALEQKIEVLELQPEVVEDNIDYVKLKERNEKLLASIEYAKPLLDQLYEGADEVQKGLLDPFFSRLQEYTLTSVEKLATKYRDELPQESPDYSAPVKEKISKIKGGFSFFDEIE